MASPQFPRLTNPDALKETISRGVGNGLLAYIGKTASDDYKPFYFSQALMIADVELFEEMFIITKETAEAYLKARTKFPTPGTEPRPDMPTPSTSALQWTLTKHHRQSRRQLSV